MIINLFLQYFFNLKFMIHYKYYHFYLFNLINKMTLHFNKMNGRHHIIKMINYFNFHRL